MLSLYDDFVLAKENAKKRKKDEVAKNKERLLAGKASIDAALGRQKRYREQQQNCENDDTVDDTVDDEDPNGKFLN